MSAPLVSHDVAVTVQRIAGKHTLSPLNYDRVYIEDAIARLTHEVWDEASEIGGHLAKDPTVEVTVTIESLAFAFPYQAIEDTVSNRIAFQKMVEEADRQRRDFFTFSMLGYRGVHQ